MYIYIVNMYVYMYVYYGNTYEYIYIYTYMYIMNIYIYMYVYHVNCGLTTPEAVIHCGGAIVAYLCR